MNQDRFPKAFFVTGTDTDVGKTLVCAVLMAGLAAAYWKPVQSGCDEGTDSRWIQRVTGLPGNRFCPERWCLKAPVSPHAAAEIDGVRIALSDFSLPDSKDTPHLIVEGAGGLMVPINDEHFMIDLMRQLGLPVLLVARSTLGTINHTLLSLAQLRQHGLHVLGVILNGPKNESNRRAIEHFGRSSVLAEIEPLNTIDPKSLAAAYRKSFNL